MAYSRLLLPLLLMGVLSSHRPGAQARSHNFWCIDQSREAMEERIEELQRRMTDCVGADTLPSSVVLPSVAVIAAQWAEKTLQQKRAEVAQAFQVFKEATMIARKQSTLQCQTSLLRALEGRIKNYLILVNQIPPLSGTMTPSPPPPPSQFTEGERQNSLTRVLEEFKRLLRGKLRYFAIDVHDSICRAGVSQTVAVRTGSPLGPPVARGPPTTNSTTYK